MKKALILLLGTLFLLSGVSAAGLQIVGNSTYNLQKNIGQDILLILEVENTDSVTFTNVSLEPSQYYLSSKIPSLAPNEKKRINLTIDSNVPFDNQFNINGKYFADIGTSDNNYDIDVYFEQGFSVCDKQIYVGDSITWKNNVLSEILLRNVQNGVEITNIPPNQTFKNTFQNPQTLKYTAYRSGFNFADICTITVLDTNEWVENPEKNAKLDIKVNINYEPTQLEVIFLEENHSLQYFEETEGFIQIRNVGSKIAKNVELQGDWFEFSDNSFDIDPGFSKAIKYIVNPKITEQNDTGKIHKKTISIKGNFEDYNKTMDIYIKPGTFSENGNYGSEGILNLLLDYCENNPEVTFCQSEKEIIYQNFSEGDLEVQVNLTKRQVDGLFREILNMKDEISQLRSSTNEKDSVWLSSVGEIKGNLSEIRGDNKATREVAEGKYDTMMFMVLLILIGLIFGAGGFAVYMTYIKRKNNMAVDWNSDFNRSERLSIDEEKYEGETNGDN